MLKLEPSLPEESAELLIALDGYLKARGIDDGRYCIVPAGSVTTSQVILRYAMPPIHGKMDAEVEWPFADGRVTLAVELASGIRLVAMLLGENWLDRCGPALTLGPRDALTQMQLPYLAYWQPTLDSVADHTFMAPYEGGYVHGYMDVRPPAHLLSWSNRAAAVALHIAASEAGLKFGIAAALARHLPD